MRPERELLSVHKQFVTVYIIAEGVPFSYIELTLSYISQRNTISYGGDNPWPVSLPRLLRPLRRDVEI